jgi:hypothetical protein
LPPKEPMAAVEASPQPARPRAVQFEGISQVLDGLTVVEMEATEMGKHVRRVVLRPDFQGGPGAALTVRF